MADSTTGDKKAEKQYSEQELERLFAEAGKKGAILALLHFDAYGKDKEVIQGALIDLVSRVTKEPGVIYCRGEVEEVLEKEVPASEGVAEKTGEGETRVGGAPGEDKAEEGKTVGKEEIVPGAAGKPLAKEYSTFTEVKVLFSSLSRAVSLCLKYAPVGIEVLEPKELKLKTEEIQNLMLDASSMSQQYTNFYMQKLLKGEEFEEFQRHLKERAERGKAYLEKAERQAGNEG